MSGSPLRRAARCVLAVVAVIAAVCVPLTATATAAGAPVAAPISDAFDAAAPNTGLWTEVDPVGDGTVAQSGGALRLSIPAGVDHDVWTGGNRSLRVLQPVANADLQVEARFASRPTQRFTSQGILAEQDTGTFIRADWYFDGSTTRVFVASFVGGTPTTRANVAVSTTAAPLFLRLTRSGSTWTAGWSTNGSTFTTVASFSFAMALARVGPFAGNAGTSPPAWTVVVDHFRNRLAPVVSSVAVAPQTTSATVTWRTNSASSSVVDWGTTEALGSTSTGTGGVTSHTVDIGGLACATTYRFRVVSASTAGHAEWWGNSAFTTGSCGSTSTTSTSTTSTSTTTSTTVPPAATYGVPAGDEFSGSSLATRWVEHDPAGDGTVSVSGGRLHLGVPGGSHHDTWTGTNRGLRVMQPIADGDFSVETKLDTPVTAKTQMNGLLVEQDDTSLLRVDVGFDGTQRRVFVGEIIDGAGVSVANLGIGAGTGPVWLRLVRLGDRWTASWSGDGTTFTDVVTFTYRIAAIRLGLFAGNAGAPAPAFTSRADYFRVRPLAGATTAVIQSDDFSAGINASRWTFVNPDGSGSVTHNGREAVLTAAAGTKDVAATNNTGPRLLQAVSNGDLRIEMKLSTAVGVGHAEGLVVEQSPSRFLRFSTRGTTRGVYLSAALVDVAAGTTTTYLDRRMRGGASLLVRFQRTASAWSLTYSYDGLHWSKGAAFVLTIPITRLGPFAATQASTTPFTARIDYIVDQSEKDPKDDGASIRPAASPPAIELFYGTDQVFGQRGIPQRWFNVLGRVRDPDGIASLTYSVDGGREQALWMGEDDSRLVEPGDFNADIAVTKLPKGTHSVRITATDRSGARTTRTVDVTNAGGGPWPRTYSLTSWASAPLASLAQVVDGRWQVQGNGTLRTTQTGYDRLLALGDLTTWTDLEVTVEVTVHDLLPKWGVGVAVGWQGHNSLQRNVLITDQPRDGHPLVAWFNYSQFNSGDFTNIYANTRTKPYQPLVKTSAVKMAEGSTYFIKGRAKRISATTSRYQMKLWKKGTTEPTSWLLTVDNDHSPGSVLLAAHQADVSWGKVTVVPL